MWQGEHRNQLFITLFSRKISMLNCVNEMCYFTEKIPYCSFLKVAVWCEFSVKLPVLINTWQFDGNFYQFGNISWNQYAGKSTFSMWKKKCVLLYSANTKIYAISAEKVVIWFARICQNNEFFRQMKLFFPQNYVNLTEKSQFLPIYKKIRQINGIFTNEQILQRILVSRNNYS